MDLLFQILKQWSAVHILTMTKNSWFSTFLRLQRFPSASVSKLGLWPRHAHQFTPRSMETPVLLNGQMPQPSHIQMHIHPHTVQTKRQSWVCVRRRERVHARSSDCYKHRYSKGLLWPQCRQRSSVNWDLFCLPQETITSLFSLCLFSLFLLVPFHLDCPWPPPLSSLPPSLYLISRMTICDLYTMPRVAEPVWLTMMSGASEKNQLCGQFMRELSLLMEQASKNQLSVSLFFHLLHY